MVASAFALYAAAVGGVGPAWAATIVACAFALIALGVAGFATGAMRHRPHDATRHGDASMSERLFAMAKERPMIALGAAAAAGVVLLRNPAVVTALITAVFAGRASKSRR